MRNITIDDTKTTIIGGVEYYYGEVTVDNGNYIVVPDTHNHILTYNNNTWTMCDGRTCCANSNVQIFRLAVRKDYANPQNVTPFDYTIEYDITPLKVVQLEDKNGYPITPYTSAKGVVLDNGNDIETQINYMDPDKISREERYAIFRIGSTTEEAIGDVREEGAEYREDIDDLAIRIEGIDAKVFPLTTTYSIIPNFNTYENTINATIKEYDTGEPSINEEYVEKWVNDGYIGKVYNPIKFSSSFSFVNEIQGMKENFRFVSKTENNKEAIVSATRYLCMYGANNADVMTSDIAMTLSKTLTTNVSFNPTITTSYGDYIWLIVPEYLSIEQVKSYGFDVTLEDPTQVNIGSFGTYKCYRTLNALDDANWDLVIK